MSLELQEDGLSCSEYQGSAQYRMKTTSDTLMSASMVPLSHLTKVRSVWQGSLSCGADSFAGGIFKLELFLPDDYPMTPPKIRFLTKIYHPNIDKLGRICLDVLKSTYHSHPRGTALMVSSGNWSPALQIRTILLSIQALLGAPNPDDPLANDVAQRWKEDQEAAIQTAREWTRTHAMT